MEVNSGFPASMTNRMDMGVTTTMAPLMDARTSPVGMASVAEPPPPTYEPFQQHILLLKERKRLQEQLLVQQYNAQRQHLAEQYEKQLQESLKVYMERQTAAAVQQQQQQQMEEEAARERDAEKLEALRHKDKSAQSAVASSEVKQRLQEFVLSKKQREAAAASASGVAVISSSSGSPPIRNWPLLKNFDEDYPLRKTASEPNLKVRLKQRVIERRSSPLRRRKDRHHPVRRRSQLANSSTGSTPDSGPSSPPSIVSGVPAVVNHQMPPSSSGTIHEEGASGGCSPFNLANATMQCGSVGDLTASLNSSSSMPNIYNISHCRPPSATSMDGPKLPTLTEAGINKIKICFPGNTGLLTSAFHPLYPVQDESGAYVASVRHVKHPTAMDQSGPLYTSMYPPGPITDAQVAHARLSKTNPGRPLNRTQSAPLPLKHPGLQGAQAAPPGFPYPNLPPGFPAHLAHSAFQQYDQQAYVRDPRHPMHVDPHNLMKQQLRATVLTRAGSKNHVENVEEETEAAVAQEMGASASEPEVIDLTGGRSRAASYRESCGRSESSSRESDGSDEQQQQQQQRLTSAKSDLERQLLARRAAAAAAAAAAVHQHQQQQQQQHLHHQQHHLHHQQAAHVHNVSDLSSGSPYAAGGPPEGFVGAAAGAPLSALRSHHVIRPLSRALSSPLVMVGGAGADPRATLSGSSSPVLRSRAGLPHVTALAYDSLMLKHQCSCGDNSSHPEHSGRLQSIWARLQETGLVSRCERIQPRKATLEEIQICHAESHTLLFGASPMNHHNIDWNRRVVALPCGGLGVDSDTTWDRLHTASAARMAVGCVLELAFKVAHGEASNGFAVVRPPGHHAEHGEPMGFCFFNNVAIAAKHLRCQLGLEKILIIDWDVHHGNGTQKMFYDDCHVLYLSIHRHDVGNFFPGTGGSTQCGADDGMGFTVNVAWSGSLNPPMGDAEYLAAFRTVVIPIAQDFHPDMILVSCGFDAARGHPAQLGGYNVSPACFAHMTRALMQLAHGKVVLALEGGYSLPAICDCSAECVRSLLGDKLPPIDDAELTRKPCQEAIDALMSTIAIQTPHWPVIRKWLPLVNMSAVEAAKHLLPGASIGVDRGSDGPFASLPSIPGHVTSKRSLFGRKSDSTEESETVNAMASLSVQHPHMSPTNGSLRRVASALARQGDSLDSKADPVDEPMDEDPVK